MGKSGDYSLVLYNDDVNSFQYIMACLIRFCKMEPIQAEQCAVIADKTGKCVIKLGSWSELEDIQLALKEMNIKVKLEIDESYLY